MHYAAFNNDAYIAMSSLDDSILNDGSGFFGSPFFGPLFNTLSQYSRLIDQINNKGKYYDDILPDNDGEQYLLSSIVDGIINILKNLTEPSFVYLHLYPPHSPYRPSQINENAFNKKPETLVRKPIHHLSDDKNAFSVLKSTNSRYDKYLLTWDSELSRLYSFFEDSGFRNDNLIIFTSDHGEIFERGEIHHWTPLLNQPIVRVPLIVSYPGGQKRQDIYSTTSSVDILPTLAHLANLNQTFKTDGQLLPFFGGIDDVNRSVYSFDSKVNPKNGGKRSFSIGLTKNKLRLLYYEYKDYQNIEFYDLNTDPEELIDLTPKNSSEFKLLKEELVEKIEEVNSSISNN